MTCCAGGCLSLRGRDWLSAGLGAVTNSRTVARLLSLERPPLPTCAARAYRIWHMVKTTVYLDAAIAVTLRQISQREGRSQAELIRDALAEFARGRKRPPIPGVGEFDSGESAVSRNAEKVLREGSVQGKYCTR